MIVDSVWRIANINALRRRCPRPWPRSPRHNRPDSDAGHPRSRRHSFWEFRATHESDRAFRKACSRRNYSNWRESSATSKSYLARRHTIS